MINENQADRDLVNLLQDLYDDLPNSYGITYFNQFVNQLRKHSFAKILACQIKYPLAYLVNLILSTPSLWVNLSDTDWIAIMSALNPRSKPFSIEFFDAGYVDIHFLCKYVRVNAIKLFLEQEQFSNEDKTKLLHYSKKVADALFMNEIDLEDLDGDYFVHKNELEKVRLNLISIGKIKPLEYTEDELREYINRELKVFSTLE
jgi:hypothetical protein